MSLKKAMRKNFSIESIESEDNIDVDPRREYDLDANKYDILFTSQNSLRNRNKVDVYTLNYRVIKTLLLILAWISFGLNLELIGPTFEDLKIYLQVNYSSISFALVLRNVGYLVLTIVFGLLLDKYSNYSESLMAMSSAILSLSNFFMPITRVYFLQLIYFLGQGMAQAIYDLVGNHIILNLWTGINTSPINAMHAGYGIGAIMATQLAKPFIKFDPYHVNLTKRALIISNNTIPLSNLTNKDINLKSPYWMASTLALIISTLFFLSQIAETKNRLRYEQNRKQLVLLSEEFDLDSSSIGTSSSLTETKFKLFIKKLIISQEKLRYMTKSQFKFMIIQIILFIVVFMFNQAYFTILSRFMITYLTIGPAKMDVEVFIVIQTLFWAFFIVGRFMAAYLAFKLDTVRFYSSILFINFLINLSFLFPFMTKFKLFFWIGISLLGLFSGPITPTGIMLAKQLLDINSFVLSLFIVGLATGGILFQQITGALLDYFTPNPKNWLGFENANSSYIIPHLACIASLMCFLSFIPIHFLHRKFS